MRRIQNATGYDVSALAETLSRPPLTTALEAGQRPHGECDEPSNIVPIRTDQTEQRAQEMEVVPQHTVRWAAVHVD
jgi:hypothetical protein